MATTSSEHSLHMHTKIGLEYARRSLAAAHTVTMDQVIRLITFLDLAFLPRSAIEGQEITERLLGPAEYSRTGLFLFAYSLQCVSLPTSGVGFSVHAEASEIDG